jgi:D-alanyl-D-alanine carboxypeptidase/D-alanyl-D-alanine-endopeptidase (penicillin-binding protein 4)
MIVTPASSVCRRAGLIIISTALATALSSIAGASASPAGDPALVTKLNSVMKDSRVRHATSGAIVLDAKNGSQLYGRNADRAITPASNTKILTAATALHVLGPGYRFKTEVIRRARPGSDGVLRGRLYLKGYGDPTTMKADFAGLARQVRAAGIRRVSGKLIVDSTFFDSVRYNPNWSTAYASDYYAAEIAALTVAPNTDYDSGTTIISYAPRSRGSRAKITTVPAAAANYVKIVNKTTTSARGTSSSFWAHRAYGTNTITVGGRVPLGRTGSWMITVHKPELYAGAVFRAELAKAGVTIAGSTAIGQLPGTSHTLVGVDRSMPLSQLLVPFMKLSNNMHAEALTKTMGTLKGNPGNWADGLSYTKAYLKSTGAPMAGVVLVDGSGLTRRNKLTPRALARFLDKIQDETWWPAFDHALPVAGNTKRMVGGTLRHRMNGTKAANNAHAKTGTLSGVTALSGYVTGADGRRYVFSMLSQHSGSTPRPVENTFVLALARWRRSA